jgi:hypothetical protein
MSKKGPRAAQKALFVILDTIKISRKLFFAASKKNLFKYI